MEKTLPFPLHVVQSTVNPHVKKNRAAVRYCYILSACSTGRLGACPAGQGVPGGWPSGHISVCSTAMAFDRVVSKSAEELGPICCDMNPV